MPTTLSALRRYTLLGFLFAVLSFYASAQDKPAYKLFTKDGKPVEFGAMIKTLAKADVVLFGELHDNAIDHWLALQVARDLFAQRADMTIGMEMFEADDQVVLQEYGQGLIEEKHLLKEAKVWDNYKTDYRPLVEFAREKKLAVIATNIPRRYASLVYKKGLDALSALPAESQRYIAPLPITVDLSLPGYKDLMHMGSHGGPMAGSAENMARSQAVKDATMAHFIQLNRKGLFLHYHGAYHSQNFEGIGWYLKKADPKVNLVTIHSTEQKAVDKLDEENNGKADFIIVIPADMTKTY